MSERFFIIDGMAIAYRAHFATIRNPLVTSDGRHVSATHGFIRALLKIIKDESPDYLAVAMDSREKTFRHHTYPEYKATREKMPFELVPQIDWIKDFVAALNIPLLEMPGYEADDIIATLARRAEDQGLTTYMVTGDKDFMQLINDRTFMYTPASAKSEITIVDADKVREKWGVGPERIIDLLALMGDSSDNVPGVPGVGEKTAVKLLQSYGSLEEVLAHGEEQKNARVRQGLTEHSDLALLSRELVTIDTQVPVNSDWDSLRLTPYDLPRLEELLRKFEFFTLLKELLPAASENSETQAYVNIDTAEKFLGFLKELENRDSFAFDTETDSTDAFQAELVGLSFSWKAWEAFYIPLRFLGKEAGLFDEDDLTYVLDRLRPILENPKIAKVGQNIKYDASVLLKYNVRLQGIRFDTMIAEYLLNPDSNSYKLDNLALHYMHYRMQPISDLIGSGRNAITMDQVAPDKAGWYACEDADITWQLTDILRGKLAESGLDKVFNSIELPLISVLTDMEANGMYLDLDFLRDMSVSLEQDLNLKIREIYDCAGQEFNINSPMQLGEILFDKLKIPPVKKTKTGYSTDVTVLEQIRSVHPLPALILDYRGMAKLKSTYVDALPQLKNPRSGRIHSSFNQTVAATGRLSSTNPNFQNIPVRSEQGREIRKAFVPENPDWVILSADYSQIELRVVAHISGDQALRDAFAQGLDIHSRTASRIFDVPEELVSQDMRRTAKVINFGILYGAGPFRISQELNIPRSQANDIIKAYFDSFPGIRDYIDRTTEFGEKNGYVETLFGRRRWIRDINSENRNLREAARRVLINTPVQGTAADLIKLAMIAIHRHFAQLRLQTLLISQVHDELIFEVHPRELDLVRQTVRHEMESVADLTVPLLVDIGVGKSWFEAH